MHGEALAPGIRRVPERGVRVAADRAHDQGAIVRLLFEQADVILLRRAPVGDDRQRLDIKDDRVDRVLRLRGIVGDHHGHRLADVAHLGVRDHRLLEGLDPGHRVRAQRDRRHDAVHRGHDLARRDHGVHAGALERSGGVDGPDAPVRYGRAHDRGVQHAVAAQVVDVPPLALEQASILDALDRPPDRSARLLDVGEVGHGRFLYAVRASSTAFTIGM